MNTVMPSFLDLDLVAIILSYLLIHQGRGGACAFAFVQGMLIDLFSAGIVGLFSLLYLALFLSIDLGRGFFDLFSVRGQIILISLGVFLKQVLFVVLLGFFSLGFHASSSILLSFALSALGTGVLAPFVFYILDHTGGGHSKAVPEGS